MRADDAVGRLVEAGGGGQGLGDEDVEGGAADLALLERVGQRVLVDRRAAPHVDDPGVLGQQREPLGVEGVLGALGPRQDHDEGVGLRQELGQPVLAVDLDAVAHAGAPRDAAHGGAPGRDVGRERLGDVAVAPDQHVRVAQRREAVPRAVGLRAAEVRRPLALHLEVAHLVEAARGVEQQAQRVLGDGAVVQARAGGHDDGGREAGRQHVVGAGGERLDPAQVLQALRGVLEVGGAVGPGHEHLGISMLLGDGALDVIGLQGHAEALQTRDVELQGRWVEQLHDGGRDVTGFHMFRKQGPSGRGTGFIENTTAFEASPMGDQLEIGVGIYLCVL